MKEELDKDVVCNEFYSNYTADIFSTQSLKGLETSK
jgi:hypothetical protein